MGIGRATQKSMLLIELFIWDNPTWRPRWRSQRLWLEQVHEVYLGWDESMHSWGNSPTPPGIWTSWLIWSGDPKRYQANVPLAIEILNHIKFPIPSLFWYCVNLKNVENRGTTSIFEQLPWILLSGGLSDLDLSWKLLSFHIINIRTSNTCLQDLSYNKPKIEPLVATITYNWVLRYKCNQ